MAKAWARQQAKKNEIAAVLERGALWIKFHPQTALWAGIGLLAAGLLGAGFANKISNEQEESWSRYAIAQSYAYSRQPQAAIEQIDNLAQTYPASAAAGYGLLLAGDLMFEQNKFTDAAQTYQRVIETPGRTDTLPLAMANLGLAQEASGDCRAAEATHQRFLETYSEHFLAAQSHASIARCQIKLGEKEKAKATMERMAFLYPNTYWAQWAQARIK